ncbi:hypothetical protein [Microvirga arsenatis]|uniref:hypothetical protein n=1 Tax=Microvirga arsenatis TaxID=2692265 RepID=UPI00191C5747|nr:hypothetical protein [Microvirga arsenatis]
MAPMSKKQRSKVARQKAALRDSLWPKLNESRLWGYGNSEGWLNIPRALPLILRIMDNMSKGKPVSATYLDLWCRTFNDAFVVAKPREMSFFSGFSGERAERTWASRMKILHDLGFIDIKDGPSGPISYVLILNPYKVVKEQYEKGNVDSKSYNALMARMIEIKATDIEDDEDLDDEDDDDIDLDDDNADDTDESKDTDRSSKGLKIKPKPEKAAKKAS